MKENKDKDVTNKEIKQETVTNVEDKAKEKVAKIIKKQKKKER